VSKGRGEVHFGCIECELFRQSGELAELAAGLFAVGRVHDYFLLGLPFGHPLQLGAQYVCFEFDFLLEHLHARVTGLYIAHGRVFVFTLINRFVGSYIFFINISIVVVIVFFSVVVFFLVIVVIVVIVFIVFVVFFLSVWSSLSMLLLFAFGFRTRVVSHYEFFRQWYA